MTVLLDTSPLLWTLADRATHVTALAALPDLHRDPFDRMLVAQAVAEGWPLVARDEQIRAYPARTIW